MVRTREHGSRFTFSSRAHVLNGSLGKRLLYEDLGLGLVEISHKAWDGYEPNTYIDGSKPIDGVWASRGLAVGGFRYGGKTYQDKKPTSIYFYCLHNQLTMC